MTSKQGKNQVRGSVWQGLHSLLGAALWVLNLFTDDGERGEGGRGGATFNFKGNEISENKADVKAFNNFGNRRNGGPYSGNSEFGFENNKIRGNEGKTEGFQDFGNVGDVARGFTPECLLGLVSAVLVLVLGGRCALFLHQFWVSSW